MSTKGSGIFKVFTRWEAKEIEENAANQIELVPDGKDNALIIGESIAVVDEKKMNVSLVKGTAVQQAVFGVILSVIVAVTTGALIALISTGVGYAPPKLKPDYIALNKNRETLIRPLDNDIDPKGANLTLVSITQPSHGLARIVDSTSISYVPLKSYSGLDYFNYTATNDKSTATTWIQVNVLNRAPTAVDLQFEVSRNTKSVSIDFFSLKNALTGESIGDLDGDDLYLVEAPVLLNETIGNITSSTNGVIELTLSHNDTMIQYSSSNASLVLTDVRNYTVSDGYDESSALLTIFVTNTPPVASPDQYIVRKYQRTVLDILSNDYDANGDELFISELFTVGFAVIYESEDRKQVIYEPQLTTDSYSDSFEYTCTDAIDTAASYVIVFVQNLPPVTQNVTISVPKNSVNATSVKLYRFDEDRFDELKIEITQDPTKGSAVLTSEPYVITELYLGRTWVDVTMHNYTIQYLPYSNRLGDDVIQFVVSDGYDTTSGYVFISIENTAPTAVDDVAHVMKNISIDIQVTNNDYDSNGDIFDLVPFASFQTANKGVVSWLNNSTLRYTPYSFFVGNDTFSYIIKDRQDDVEYVKQGSATVTLIVENQPPIALPDYYLIQKGVSTHLDVMSNDTDPNRGPLFFVQVDPTFSGAKTTISTGSIVYNALNSTGIDRFIYTIRDLDGANATTTVTLEVSNTPPVASNDSYTVTWNRASLLSILSNDVDDNPGDWDQLQITQIPLVPSHGNVEIISGRSIRYTPNSGYVGNDLFSYIVNDGYDSSNIAFVNITVRNQAPIANPKTISFHWSQMTYTLDVLSLDVDPDGDTLDITHIINQGLNGNATIVSSKIRYTPNFGFVGSDIFTYEITDGEKIAIGLVNITVQNYRPNAVADTATVHWLKPSGIVLPVLQNDYDLDSDPISIISYAPFSPFDGTLSRSDTNFQFVPSGHWKGVQVFEYTIWDGIQTSKANVTINVVNEDVPKASTISPTIHWSTETVGTSITLYPILNPTDNDGDYLNFTLFQSSHGHASLDDSKGRVDLLYVQNSKFLGIDTFKLQVCDGLDCANTTYTFTVYNNPPQALNSSISFYWKSIESSCAQVNLLSVASDPDTQDTLTILSVTDEISSQGISVLSPGGFCYTPTSGFVGAHRIDAIVTDGIENRTILVDVSITNNLPALKSNLAPLSTPWSTQTTGTVIDVLSMITDANGDIISIDIVESVLNGSAGKVFVNGKYQIQYKQPTGFLGVDTFTVRITDGWSFVSIPFNITVYNHDPVVPSVTISIHWNNYINGKAFNVLSAASDADSDPITIFNVTINAANGTAVRTADNRIKYTPNMKFVGFDSFQLTITDGIALVKQTVFVNVTNTNPIANNDDMSELHWRTGSKSFNLLANDVDPDGDSFAIQAIVVQPSSGNATIIDSQNGLVTYSTSQPPALGHFSFRYTITDSVSLSNSAVVTISVTNNDRPSTSNITKTTHWRQLLGEPIVFQVYSSRLDDDGDTMTLTFDPPTLGGSVALLTDSSGVNSMKYHHDYFVGYETFPYSLSDGLSSSSSVIGVNVTNTAPTCRNYQLSLHYQELIDGVTIFVRRDIFDADIFDSYYLEFYLSSSAMSQGNISKVDENSVFYMPTNDTGTIVFDYYVTDGMKNSTCNLTMTVNDIYYNPYSLFAKVEWSEVKAGKDIPIFIDTSLIRNSTFSISNITTQPAFGEASINGRYILYKQSQINLERDSVTFTVIDGTNSASVTLVIQVYNTPPLITPWKFSFTHNMLPAGSVDLTLLSSTTDQDGDSLQVLPGFAMLSTGISVTQTNSTSVQFRTDTINQIGIFYFSYTVSDGFENTTGLVTVEITNGQPIVPPTNYTLHWREILSPTGKLLDHILDNAHDSDGDSILIVNVTSSCSKQVISSITVESGTSVRVIAPATGQTSGDCFISYLVTDGVVFVSSSIDLTIYNNPPVNLNTLGDQFNVHYSLRNIELNVLSNFTDPDSLDQTNLKVATMLPSFLNLTSDGKHVYFTPPTTDKTSYSLSYSVSDGMLATPGSAIVTVYNHPPQAQNYNISLYWEDLISQGGSFLLNVGSDSSDADVEDEGYLYITSCSTSGTIFQGQFNCTTNNTILFIKPSQGFVATALFEYDLTDRLDSSKGIAYVSISNSIPYIDNSAHYYQVHWRARLNNVGAQLNLTQVMKDNDVSGHVSIVSVRNSTNGGTALVIDSQRILFIPSTNVNSNDTIQVTITDGWSQNIQSVLVNVYNNAPTVSAKTLYLHQGQNITLLVVTPGIANDVDSEDITYLRIQNGTLGGTGLKVDSLNTTSDLKSIVIKQASSQPLDTQTITYSVTDGLALVSGSIIVILNNTKPVVPNMVMSIHWSTYLNGVNISLLANATDIDGDRLYVVQITTPSQGVITSQNSNPYGDLINYKPAAFNLQTCTFSYLVSDNATTVSVSATVYVYNNDPIARNDYLYQHWKNSSFDIYPLANDLDADGDVLSISSTDSIAYPTGTSPPTIQKSTDNKKLNFAKKVEVNDLTSNTTFRYSMSDQISALMFANVTVQFYNTQPLITTTSALQTAMMWVDSAWSPQNVTYQMSCTDSDSQDSPILSIKSGGQYVILNTTVSLDYGSISKSGSILTYTPTTSLITFSGCATGRCFVTESLQFLCSDGLLSDIRVATINITNSRPQLLAVNQTITIPRQSTNGASTTIDVIPSTYLTDDDGNTISILSSSLNPSSTGGLAVVLLNRYQVKVSVSASFSSVTSFTYALTDGQLTSATGTVFINVTNIPPTCTAIAPIVVSKGGSANVRLDCTDPNGDSLSYSVDPIPSSYGSVQLTSSGSQNFIKYSGSSNGVAPFSIIYRVSDGVATSVFAISAQVQNNPPIASSYIYNFTKPSVAPSATTSQFYFDYISDAQVDDSDNSLSTLYIRSVLSSNCGTGALAPAARVGTVARSLLLTIDPSSFSSCQASVEISDGDSGWEAITVVNITFNYIKQGVVANNDRVTISQSDSSASYPVSWLLRNDYDPMGSPIEFVQFTCSGGTCPTISTSGSTKYFSIVPNTDSCEVKTYQYVVRSTSNNTRTATGTLYVENSNCDTCGTDKIEVLFAWDVAKGQGDKYKIVRSILDKIASDLLQASTQVRLAFGTFSTKVIDYQELTSSSDEFTDSTSDVSLDSSSNTNHRYIMERGAMYYSTSKRTGARTVTFLLTDDGPNYPCKCGDSYCNTAGEKCSAVTLYQSTCSACSDNRCMPCADPVPAAQALNTLNTTLNRWDNKVVVIPLGSNLGTYEMRSFKRMGFDNQFGRSIMPVDWSDLSPGQGRINRFARQMETQICSSIDTRLYETGQYRVNADDYFSLYVNNVLIVAGNKWSNVYQGQLTIQAGDMIVLEGENTGGVRGIIFETILGDRVIQTIGTGSDAWKCSTGFLDVKPVRSDDLSVKGWTTANEQTNEDNWLYSGFLASTKWIWGSKNSNKVTCAFMVPELADLPTFCTAPPCFPGVNMH